MQKSGHHCTLKTLERIRSRAWRGQRRILGSRWNALAAIRQRGRFLGCLTYGRRVLKWILVESIAQPSPTDIVQSRLGRCSSLLQVGKGMVSL